MSDLLLTIGNVSGTQAIICIYIKAKNTMSPVLARRALLLRRVYPEWVGFYPLTKCPLRRANSWVQDLCKHPSILPYPAPPKEKIHKMAPREQPPP